MAVDRDDLVATLARLVQINSINPTLVPGAPGEREIAAYVGGWLASAGLEVRTLESTPGRPSIVARLPGTGRGRSLMLNAHIDTVDVAGMPEPLSGAIRNGRLYGRGSYDMKGSLAACMMAARTLAAAKRLGGDLIVAAVADEEYGSLGTRIVELHPLTLIQNARTSGGGNIPLVPTHALTVGPRQTWMAEKVSIWHPGVHDNPFGMRLTTLMISKRICDSSVPMSLLANHPNVQFTFFRGGIGTCEAEMHER